MAVEALLHTSSKTNCFVLAIGVLMYNTVSGVIHNTTYVFTKWIILIPHDNTM